MALTNESQLRFLWRTGTEAVTADGTNIKESDVVFLPEKHQLWANGVYFGLTDAQKTALETATSDISTLNGQMSAVQTRVEITTQLSKTLVEIADELKAKVDGGQYSPTAAAGSTIAVTDTNNDAITNLTDAVNRVWAVAQAASSSAGVTSIGNDTQDQSITITGTGQGPYTGAITLKTDASKIKTVTAITQTDGKGVSITAGTSVESALSTINEKLKTDETAIATAQTTAEQAASAASQAASNSITKSSGTTGQKTGIQDSALTNAAAIVTALESAYTQMLGSSQNWSGTEGEQGAEARTLGQLRDLIAGLRTDLGNLQTSVGTLSDADFASITDAINKIKAELSNPDNQNGITSFLDTVKPIIGGAVASGENAGKYATASGTNGATEYATNLGDIITNLEKEIAAAKTAGMEAGVTSLNTKSGAVTIANGTGTTVDNSGNNIVINASSAATTTAALTQQQTGYGATTASGATIQTALQDINNAASNAGKSANDANNAASAAQLTADGAVDAAGAAQSSADAALAQLKWVVVSSGNQNNEP